MANGSSQFNAALLIQVGWDCSPLKFSWVSLDKPYIWPPASTMWG